MLNSVRSIRATAGKTSLSYCRSLPLLLEKPPMSGFVVGTVARAAPISRGGELMIVDAKGDVLRRTVIAPDDPPIQVDPNARGNGRGCRGVAVINGRIYAASYHSLEVFDLALNRLGRLSDHTFTGLHEVAHVAGTDDLWVTATSIDMAALINLSTGQVTRRIFVRNSPRLAALSDATPMPIDETRDNRLAYLAHAFAEDRGHLHLNAITLIEGRPVALLSSRGMIVDLSAERVLCRDPRLFGTHNLLSLEDGLVAVAGSPRASVLLVDVRAGEIVYECDLLNAAPVRAWVQAVVDAPGPEIAKPGFTRGLALRPTGGLVVGMAPACLVLLARERNTLTFEDLLPLSRDVRVAVHGLAISPELP